MKKYKTLKLFVLFIFIAIAFFFIFKYANTKIEEKKSDDIKTNMLIIQKKVKTINGIKKVNADETVLIGTKLSEIENDDIKNKIKNVGVNDEELEKYFLLNIEDFKNMKIYEELSNVSESEYVVNYELEEVIYLNGINTKDATAYKLSDLNKQ